MILTMWIIPTNTSRTCFSSCLSSRLRVVFLSAVSALLSLNAVQPLKSILCSDFFTFRHHADTYPGCSFLHRCGPCSPARRRSASAEGCSGPDSDTGTRLLCTPSHSRSVSKDAGAASRRSHQHRDRTEGAALQNHEGLCHRSHASTKDAKCF